MKSLVGIDLRVVLGKRKKALLGLKTITRH